MNNVLLINNEQGTVVEELHGSFGMVKETHFVNNWFETLGKKKGWWFNKLDLQNNRYSTQGMMTRSNDARLHAAIWNLN